MNAQVARRIVLAGLLILHISGHAFDFGPLLDEFPLTLAPGERLEALGPFYYEQQSESQQTRAVPPLFSKTEDPELEYAEFDFLYPLLTYDRFGDQYRLQIMQLLSFAGGATQTETNRDRFTLFPVIFLQKSSDTNENYRAVLPFYGHLKRRFSRDEIFFVAFPLYLDSWKKDVYTRNYLFPFFHVREGDNLSGWQFWPVLGHQSKSVTYTTNGFGDAVLIGGHDRWFAAWPLYYNQHNELETTNAMHAHGLLPAYAILRSARRDSTTVLWPFFTKIHDRGKKYREWQGPWPFVAFARGEGKQLNRVLPFYSHGKTATHENRSYGWVLWRENILRLPSVERRRERVLFFLYSNIAEKNKETGATRKRMDLWPLFTTRQDFNGNRRLQVFAPLEPLLANNKSIERNYSPLWSAWRSEHNPQTGASSQSLLWNLYRRDVTPDSRKTSLLFGLYRYVKDAGGKQVRLFHIPLSGARGGKAQGERPALEKGNER